MSEPNPDQLLGAFIQRHRQTLGLSQGDLAAKLRKRGLNWSQGTLSRVELGERPVRLAETLTLANALSIPPENLLMASEQPEDHRRLLDAHEQVLDSMSAMSGWFNRIYDGIETVGEVLDESPNLGDLLWAQIVTESTAGRDYRAWLASDGARQIAAKEHPPLGYFANSDAKGVSLLSIPAALVGLSIFVLDDDAPKNVDGQDLLDAALPTRDPFWYLTALQRQMNMDTQLDSTPDRTGRDDA